jgi:peptidoglycan/xylan/chitin deacetylase (PgdA/CDA1 family)
MGDIMKKNLLLLLSIFLISFISYPRQTVGAIEDSGNYYLVETENLETHVYSDIQNQIKIKMIIPKGQKVVVIGESVQGLHIQHNGNTGWIKKIGLKKIEIKNQFFTSASIEVPIRRGALTSYRQVDSLQKGQIVKAIAGFTNSRGEKWIRIDNGRVTGWVPLSSMELFNGEKNYLNKNVFLNKETQVRRGASFSERISFTINKGKQVTIQSFIHINDDIWYRIKDGSGSGWIPAADTANLQDLSAYFYIKNTKVKVRRGAAPGYKVVSNLTLGQKVEATKQFIGGDNEIWYKVVLGNGKDGWVIGTSFTTKNLKIAYLTIDDGPSNYTNLLLDTLNKYNVKATFFMINGQMNTHPSEVKRMVKEGHTLGSHSVTHNKSKFYRSPSSAVNEMITTRSTIHKITGINTNLIRVPYGSAPFMKSSYRDAMNDEHFIMWDWNIDSLDWKFNSSEYVSHTLNQVKTQEKSGKIPTILIHDRKTTIDHLPTLLNALQKQGYTFVPINESIQPYQF